MKLHAAITANIAAAVDADNRPDEDIAAASWPDKTMRAALIKFNCMCDGERLTVGNIDDLARGLGIKCDDLTSTETDAARAALETQT